VPPALHQDAEAIIAKLRGEGITALYHFTSVENLASICQQRALLSKAELESRGLSRPPVPGGNELSLKLDREHGNWDKVSLSLTPHTPMAYHRKREIHICFFVIRIEVAARAGVIFTDSNAASRHQRRGEGLPGINLINFSAIRSLPRPGDREGWVNPVQAEVLVRTGISLPFLDHVAFVSSSSMAYAERLVEGLPHPEFRINEALFADAPNRQAADFAHVREFFLTEGPLEHDKVNLQHADITVFRKSATPYLTLVTLLRASAGARVSFRFQPSDNSNEVTLESSREVYILVHLLAEAFPVGANTASVFINEIQWSTLDFEIEE
jgi:hypothetical protein